MSNNVLGTSRAQLGRRAVPEHVAPIKRPGRRCSGHRAVVREYPPLGQVVYLLGEVFDFLIQNPIELVFVIGQR